MDMLNLDGIELTMDEEFAAFKIMTDAKRKPLGTIRYGELIKEGKSQLEASRLSEEYEKSLEIDLTEEETEKCILRAKEDKHYKIKANAYFESLKSPRVYEKPSKDQYRKFVIDRVENITGQKFITSEQFETLMLYFMGDTEFEKRGEYYSLKKGIMLVGPVGCGKTTLMKAFSVNPHQSYSIVPCRTISNLYTKSGPLGIAKYYDFSTNKMPQMYFGQEKLGWCPDDIGTEKAAQHYGSELETIQDIYSDWYDTKGSGFYGMHGTSNLDGSGIEQRYDDRLRSRFRAMFNWITFDKSEKDKRK